MLELTDSLSEKLLTSYESYPSSKTVKLLQGYLYLLKDRSYPEYVKLGMTRNLARRHKEYNAHKPFDTAEYVVVSQVFQDVEYVEKKILEVVYRQVHPIGARREWFELEHEELLREAITQAECHFNLYIPYR